MRARWRLWWPVFLLGLATIGAYGTAYYSIGVLIPVVAGATGWGTSALAGGFSLGMLGQGALALLAGHVFDRWGSRPVMLTAAIAGATLLLLASLAQESWQFTLAWAIGGATIGGGLYYNLTMPVTARLYAGNRVAAFSGLTLLGALASPIFYPLTAWLTDVLQWRTALQVLVGLMLLCVLPAAVFVRAGPSTDRRMRERDATVWHTLRDGTVLRTLAVLALAASASSAVLLHQVAMIEAAGLTLAAASGFAGARGAFQITGRLFLAPVTSRLGVTRAIGICYALAATATLALLVAVLQASGYALVAYFAIVSGVSLGLLSPLSGLFQAEVFGEARLGTLSGVTVIVASVGGAAGAALSGVAVDAVGGYEPVLLTASCLHVVAVVVLLWRRRSSVLVAPTSPSVRTSVIRSSEASSQRTQP